jgi:hypothetical protein
VTVMVLAFAMVKASELERAIALPLALVKAMELVIALALMRAVQLPVSQSAALQRPCSIVLWMPELESDSRLIPAPTNRRLFLHWRRWSAIVFDPVP